MTQPNHTDDTFLARWLENELSEEELLDFSGSADYGLFERISRKSQELLPADFNAEINFALLQKEIQAIRSKKKVRRLYYQLAAGMAAVLMIGLGLLQFLGQQAVYVCGVGEKISYTLPDSSIAEMNGKSTIKLSGKDWKNSRRDLELEGESYFRVRKGSVFTVKTSMGTVTVAGTQFNVRVLKDYFAVECYQGRVRVQAGPSQTLLLPGKGIRFHKNRMERFVTGSPKPDWKTGHYKYEGIPLFIVLNDLQNSYKVTINAGDIDTGQAFSGQLIPGNLEKALAVICRPLGLEYQIEDKTVFLRQN